MINTETTKTRWYENKTLIVLFLFVLPPVGIYCIFKRNTQLWKRLLYTLFAILSSMFLLMVITAIVNPVDYYKTGYNHFKEGFYPLAIESLKDVDKTDKNYSNAQKLIELSKKKIDEQIALEQKKELEKLEKLKNFQNEWSNGVVKYWKGDYFKKSILVNSLDTIYFQLIKVASTGNWKSSAEMNREIYQKEYDSLVKQRFGNEFANIKTQVKIIPDSEQEKANQVISQRTKKIQMQFSAWDGSHSGLKRLIKENMNDPSSFDHIQTTYADKGSYILVQMKYRGKNAFGAKVIELATAKIDLDGNILSVN